MMFFAFIATYLIGLLTFYTFATFDTYAWDISYFGWAKACDAGVLAMGAMYEKFSVKDRKYIKWLLIFAVIRFLADIQSFFTGIGVNNNKIVAVLFLLLICLISYLTLFVEGKLSKWLSKQLRI